LVVAFVVSCVPHARGIYDTKQQNVSVVVGYVDMSEAGGVDIDDLKLFRLDNNSRLIQGYPDYFDGVNVNKMRPGNFWVPGLVNGEYQIAEIAGMGFSGGAPQYGATRGPVRNALAFSKDEKNASYIKIDKPGIYFMGSFKAKVSGDSFSFKKVKKPTEAQVLKRLLEKRTFSPYWKKVIEARLVALNKKKS